MGILSDMLKEVGKGAEEAGGFTEKLVFGASAGLAEVPVIGEAFKQPIGPRERAFRKKYGGPMGKQGGAPQEEETDASLLGLASSDPNAFIQQSMSTMWASLQDRVRQQGGFTDQDRTQMSAMANLMTGQATGDEELAALNDIISSDLMQKTLDGTFDDPSDAMPYFEQLGKISQQREQLTGLGGTAVDPMVQMALEDNRRASALEQAGFYRQSLFGILDALPVQVRMQVIPGMLSDPMFRNLLFPPDIGPMDMGFGGGSAGGAPTTPTSSGQPPLPKWMNQ